MSWVHENLTEQFYNWELRGRGWRVFGSPVAPEPPFEPFFGHFLPQQQSIDDGRQQTVISSRLVKLRQRIGMPSPPTLPPIPEAEPEPDILERDPLVELQTSLPANLNIARDTFEQFLTHLSLCAEPIAFELLG